MVREKRTISGRLFEGDFYPVFADGKQIPARPPKTKRSTAAQAKYNKNQASKKLVRLINANFDSTDYFAHPTYKPGKAPSTKKEAKRDVKNALGRIKTKRKSTLKRLKKDLLEAKAAASALPDNKFLAEKVKELKKQIRKLKKPFKYIYVIEKTEYKSEKMAGKINWHFHLFMTGGLDREIIEKIWGKGGMNCDNFQPDTFGPEAAAEYMAKDPQGEKAYVCSQNLTKPKEKKRDGIISKNAVEKMARERIDDKDFWERRYKGYKFVRCFPRFNTYNSNWYLTVIMFKTDGEAPPWKDDSWADDNWDIE